MTQTWTAQGAGYDRKHVHTTGWYVAKNAGAGWLIVTPQHQVVGGHFGVPVKLADAKAAAERMATR